MKWLVLLCLLLGCACQRQAPPTPAPLAAPALPTPAPEVIAQVDLGQVTLAQVRERLGQTVHADSADTAAAEAILAAATDVLVIREMAVLKEAPKADERPWQAVDRFLSAVWNGKGGCNLGKDDLRWTYLREVGRYKHPASTTVWDAQFVCCDTTAGCPITEEEACRKRLRPLADRLSQDLRAAFARMPPLGAAAEVTLTTIDDSPVRALRVPEFEAQVAGLTDKEPKVQLRRYTFFARGEPGFEKAHFRSTDPAMEQDALRRHLGEIAGPIDTAWGADVYMVVAREPSKNGGLEQAEIRSEVEKQACADAATQERNLYRQKLLAGARVLWNKDLIVKAFGKRVMALLPPDASARELPHIPPGF